MPEAIKIKLAVEGADVAKKAIDDVTQAVEDGGRASEKASAATESAASKEIAVHEKRGKAIKEVREAADSAAKAIEAVTRATDQSSGAASAEGRSRAGVFETVRAQNEAMRETTRVFVERMQAERAAKGATDNDTESLSALEKQAKRAADQVERLALAKGKSAEVANAMADRTFESVSAGRVSPAAAVWNARTGFAAEAQALKDIAAQSGPASEGMGKVGGAVADTATKTQGLISAGRLVANAFLPDMWVARTLSAGRALIGVLSGMSAGALGLLGVIAVPFVAAFVAMRKAWKEDEEAGEKLNRTMEEQARLAEQSANRHDLLARTLGPAYFEAERANKEAALAAERYVGTLRQASDASDRLYASEQKRIALSERGEKAAIRAEYAPKLAAIRRDEIALRAEEATAESAFVKELGGSKSLDESRSIEARHAAARAAFGLRASRLRDQAAELEGEQGDRLAIAERKATERQAVSASEHSARQADIDAKAIAVAAEAHINAATELNRLAESVAKFNEDFRSSKGLFAHAGILDMVSDEKRREQLNDLVTNRTKDIEKAKGLDEKINQLGSGRSFGSKAEEAFEWVFASDNAKQARLKKLQETQVERAHLGNPEGDISLLKSLIAADADFEKQRAKKNQAEASEAQARMKAAESAEQARYDAEALRYVRSESGTSSLERDVASEARKSGLRGSSSVREAREAAGQDYLSKSAMLARVMWRDVNEQAPSLGVDQGKFDKLSTDALPALRDMADPAKNNGASLARALDLMQKMADILKLHAADSVKNREKLALLERDIATAKNLSEQTSSQLRAAR